MLGSFDGSELLLDRATPTWKESSAPARLSIAKRVQPSENGTGIDPLHKTAHVFLDDSTEVLVMLSFM